MLDKISKTYLEILGGSILGALFYKCFRHHKLFKKIKRKLFKHSWEYYYE